MSWCGVCGLGFGLHSPVGWSRSSSESTTSRCGKDRRCGGVEPSCACLGGGGHPPRTPPPPLPRADPLPFSQHSLAPQGGAGWVDKTTLLKMLSEQVASKAIEQVGSKMLSEQVRVASVSIGTLAHVLTIFFQRCGRRSMDSSNSFGRYPVHVPHLPPRTDTQVQSSKCVVHVDSVFFRFFQSRF